MIRRMQRKMIAATMLSLLTVLAVIIGIVNAVNFREIVRDADSVLAILRDNGGSFPAPESFSWEAAGARFQSPELPFETRYFSVTIQADGALLSSEVGQIAAVNAESVAEYAQRAREQKPASGFVDSYRYLRYAEGENTRILFLDCGRILAGFQAVLLSSIWIALAGYAAVFVLVVIFSRRIVRPISESYEKQKRFITDAGHEIKTPISIIKANAALLEMDAGKSEWLDGIRIQADHLTNLTNDLICLSRMEEGEKLAVSEFPLSDLVLETAEEFRAPALAQEKQFSMDIQPSLFFTGNEKSIAQLVSILLDNALKYSDASGSIALSLKKRGKSIVLCAENSVREISQETIGSMFDRFYRADSSRNSKQRGHGIGLSIAKAIAQAHRGKIAAQAVGENRLRITVTLPL